MFSFYSRVSAQRKTILMVIILILFQSLMGCQDKAKAENKTSDNKSSARVVAETMSETVSKKTSHKPAAAVKKKSLQQDYAKTEFKIIDFDQRSYDGSASLGLVFSVPLDETTALQKYLLVERRDGQRVDGAWVVSNNGREAFFTNIEPETDYLVTVYGNLTAVNGQTLKQRFKKSLTTRAIESTVSFAQTAGILPLSFSQGLPVYSINTDAVDIDFHRIDSDKITDFLNQWRGRSRASYYQLQQFSSDGQLVHTARFDLPVQKNKRQRVLLPVNNIAALKPAGVYLAVMKSAGKYSYRQSVSYFTRSDIGVHVRRYPGKLRVYIRSLKTGEALANVKVSLLDVDNKPMLEKYSDKQGMIQFSGELQKARVILARMDNQISLLNLNSPALDLSEFNVGQRQQYQNEAFFYSPRDIYRPGDSVDISLLLRNYDGQPIPDIPLNAVIKRQDGQIMAQFVWQAQYPGYYYQYQLGSEVKTGQWKIEIELPDQAVKKGTSVRHWSFSVEDFLPERLKLEFPGSSRGMLIHADEILNVELAGAYLYGAPAAGNRLETRIKTFIDQRAVDALPGYYFGLGSEKGAQKTIEIQDVFLDKEGKAHLKINPDLKSIYSPVLLRLTASLFETGGRAIKRQMQYRYWPAQTLIGIRPGWQADKQLKIKEAKENSILSFDVVNASYKGELKAADNLQVKLIKKRRDYFWKYNNYDEWEMDYSEKQYPVYQQKISIKDGAKQTIKVPVEWGDYRLEVKDPTTGQKSSLEFNAGGSWYIANQQAQVIRPDKINLLLDKESYTAEDSIKLTIKSPFKGSGFVILENGRKMLWEQPVELLKSNQLSINIPMQKNWQSHDIYISAVLFNKPQQNVSNQLNPQISKKRAMGLIHLPLQREDRKLALEISSAEKIKPLTALNINVKVSNLAALKDKKIMLTVAAVDVGVLNVSNFKTPDPFNWFYAQRRYSVDSLDVYGNIIDGQKGIMGKQRFGGDMDLSNAGNLQKAKVKIVSIFHQPVSFNEQGEAQITLDIPDFNGKLRLMAVAFGGSSFGHAQSDIIVASPVVTQVSMPRFLAANDQSQIALDIDNLSGQKQTLTLKLSADKVLSVSDADRQITLQADDRKTLYFDIKSAQDFGLADIELNLTNNADIAIKRHWQLAVRPAWPAVQRVKRQVLNPSEEMDVSIAVEDLMPQTLAANLMISAQPPLNLRSQFEQLFKYPYGCLEQSVSSTYPWLYAQQKNLQKLGLSDARINEQTIDFSRRKQYLSRGIKRILAKQLANGGFGLWSNTSNEEFWLTAYASEFLLEARTQQLEIPQAALKSALKRLQQYLHSSRPGYDYRYSKYPEHLSFAYKAYAAYVLSMINQAPLGTLRALYDYHAGDAHSGLPLMHLGIALYRQGDRKRAQQAIKKALTYKMEDNDYLGDYGSKLRDISLMLDLLVQFKPDHEGVKQLIFKLQDELATRSWLSTQERNALFKTGIALMNNNNESWQAFIRNQSGTLKIKNVGDFRYSLKQDEILTGLHLQSQSKLPLYIEYAVGGYTQTPPEQQTDHFSITRNYYNDKGEHIIPQKLAVGDVLIVELTIHSKQRIQDALVVDLLPAGFELENQNLAHSLKLGDFTIGSKSISDRISTSAIKYQQWRDDRYIAALDIQGYGTQRLYYLLRAVTPGIYQVPAPYAEDMYRPYIRAIGETTEAQTIVNRF